MVEQLQKAPRNRALREKIIRQATTVKSGMSILQETVCKMILKRNHILINV
jgi:hypothetical protein